MPISTEILAPAVALMLLTSLVWAWMYATRLPAIQKAGLEMNPEAPSGAQMAQLPAKVRWKADNYNHLHEQPTLFYAVCLTLALLGEGSGLNLTLAWSYVGIRVVHTVHQSLWNKIELRFTIFTLASLVLIALIVRTALIIW